MEFIAKKLDHIRQQCLNRLGKRTKILKSNQETTFKTFIDLEKFVEHQLGVSEKDFKKYIIFHLILLTSSSLKQLSDMNLTGLLELLRKEGKYEVEQNANDKVKEEKVKKPSEAVKKDS